VASKITRAFLDRLEDQSAVVLLGPDGEAECRLPVAALPEGASPGASLLLTLETDPEGTTRLKDDIATLMKRLDDRKPLD
jgi:hypothetical protein